MASPLPFTHLSPGRGTLETVLGLASSGLLDSLCLKNLKLSTRLAKCGSTSSYSPELLLLFTTLASDIIPGKLASLFLKRWNIELSLRHFKCQMGLGELSVKSPAMARRELFTGVLAHNLVRGVMPLASARSGEPLATMSFAKARAGTRRHDH